MKVYSTEILIKAHEDVNIQYKNHSYPRYVREVLCGCCGHSLGEQQRYTDFDKEFNFVDNDKNNWTCCPYCGGKI